jgi:methyl coenzyme M reductase subunit C-like uncharacterized protein (methanogenesis marker protein 7)
MRRYEPKPIHVIRLAITKIGEEAKYLTFVDVTQDECIKKVTSIIAEIKVPVFVKGVNTRMDFRDCVGSKAGKSKSISFKGLSPAEVHKLLTEKVPLKN